MYATVRAKGEDAIDCVLKGTCSTGYTSFKSLLAVVANRHRSTTGNLEAYSDTERSASRMVEFQLLQVAVNRLANFPHGVRLCELDLFFGEELPWNRLMAAVRTEARQVVTCEASAWLNFEVPEARPRGAFTTDRSVRILGDRNTDSIAKLIEVAEPKCHGCQSAWSSYLPTKLLHQPSPVGAVDWNPSHVLPSIRLPHVPSVRGNLHLTMHHIINCLGYPRRPVAV